MAQSNEPTTDQMNETIARFMGYKCEHQGHRRPHPTLTFKVDNVWWPVNALKYHTSWDWLMTVIEKIETPQYDANGKFIYLTSADVQITYKACIIEYEPDEESGDPHEEIKIQTVGDTKIEAVHKAVYQFITWYNQYQQTTTDGCKPE